MYWTSPSALFPVSWKQHTRPNVLPIRIFPDPILRQKAHPIQTINPGIIRLGQDMIATMQKAGGVGLAGNQVGVLKRIIAVHAPQEEAQIMINPVIRTRFGQREVEEGCLSVPGYTGLVNRSVRVNANYIDINGDRFSLTAEEIMAQIIEHEVDHLNGIMFLDHLAAHDKLAKTGISPDEPHWHEVGYDVYIERSGANPSDKDMVERLKVIADMSKITPESNSDEMRYEFINSNSETLSVGDLPRGLSRLKGYL